MVTEERKRPVFVVCPGRWQIAPQLRNGCESCPSHPSRDAEGGAVSGRAVGHRYLETGGLVMTHVGAGALFRRGLRWVRTGMTSWRKEFTGRRYRGSSPMTL